MHEHSGNNLFMKNFPILMLALVVLTPSQSFADTTVPQGVYSDGNFTVTVENATVHFQRPFLNMQSDAPLALDQAGHFEGTARYSLPYNQCSDGNSPCEFDFSGTFVHGQPYDLIDLTLGEDHYLLSKTRI
jgi:hypothetical protein